MMSSIREAACTLLTNYSGLKIYKDGPGNVLASTSLAKEGVEGVIPATDRLVGGHLAIRLDTVLQAVQLPAGIADLNAGLANVDTDALTLQGQKKKEHNKYIDHDVILSLGRYFYISLLIEVHLEK